MSKTGNPGVLFVTFSGAQGTGKSTMAGQLCAHLNKEQGKGSAIFVPSFTGKLFDRLKGGTVEAASTIAGETRRPSNYAEIDKFGFRRWYQMNLPSACAFEVEAVMLSIKKSRGRRKPVYFVVLDRWFPDILSYTKIEARDDISLGVDVRKRCRNNYRSIIESARMQFSVVSELNVFVPLSASKFDLKGQEGKFRATCDRDEFERVCLAAWKPTLGRDRYDLCITETDRDKRLGEVMRMIDQTTNANR